MTQEDSLSLSAIDSHITLIWLYKLFLDSEWTNVPEVPEILISYKINFSILYIISAETSGYLNICTIKTSSTKFNYYIYVHGIVGIHFPPSYLNKIFWLMWFLSRWGTNSYWELHSQRIASNRLTLKCTPVLIIVNRKSEFKYFLSTVSNQSTYIASWRNTWVKK